MSDMTTPITPERGEEIEIMGLILTMQDTEHAERVVAYINKLRAALDHERQWTHCSRCTAP